MTVLFEMEYKGRKIEVLHEFDAEILYIDGGFCFQVELEKDPIKMREQMTEFIEDTWDMIMERIGADKQDEEPEYYEPSYTNCGDGGCVYCEPHRFIR